MAENENINNKPDKIILKLIGAGSCNYDGTVLKKGQTIELKSPQAEKYLKSGLFVKI